MSKSINSRVILGFLHLLSLCVMVFSFPIPIDVPNDSIGKISVHSAITGVLLIVLGIVYCFFGRKYYRATMFIAGFYVGALITWIILENAQPSEGYGSASDTVILIVSIFAGILVGLIFLWCSSVAVWFIGALGGYVLAVYLLSMANGGVIHSRTGQAIFILIFTVIGFILAVVFELQYVIFATAFIGAYSITIGIDVFARTGYKEATRLFLDGKNPDIKYTTDLKIFAMIAAQFNLFMIGAYVQWKLYRDGAFGPDRTVQVEDGKRTWRNWYKR